MSATAEAIGQFKQIIQKHSRKGDGNASTLQKKLERCSTIVPTSATSGKQVEQFFQRRAQISEQLAQELLTAKLMEHFPLIDPSLFDLKRHLLLQDDNKLVVDATTEEECVQPDDDEADAKNKKTKKPKTKTVACPLFVTAKMAGDGTWPGKVNLASFSRTNRHSRYYSTRTKVDISTNLEPPPVDVLAKGYAALGTYHRLLSEMLSDKSLVSSVGLISNMSAGLILAWIPASSSLNIKVEKTIVQPKSRDPALMLEVGSNRFLIDTYEISEEEPFENLLREFTTGNLAGKIKSRKK